jgi:hypothetical protein
MTWEGVPETLNDKDYLEQVSMVLAGLVNNHVMRYPTVLIPAFRFEDEAEPGQFVFGRQPPSLHAALYTEFATMIAQQAELKECLGCGRIFPPSPASKDTAPRAAPTPAVGTGGRIARQSSSPYVSQHIRRDSYLLAGIGIERLALLADGGSRYVAGHMERTLLVASYLPSPLPRLPLVVSFQ